jgi:hypothetical protein
MLVRKAIKSSRMEEAYISEIYDYCVGGKEKMSGS